MEKVFDFNIHLPHFYLNDWNHLVYDESDYTIEQLKKNYEHFAVELKEYVCGGNFMFLNESILFQEGIHGILSKLKNDFESCLFTFIIDFRRDDCESLVEKAIEHGAAGIKFHSYLQKICFEDFENVLRITKYAEQKNLFVCIDTSYGTSGMYKYDNLKLAAFLSEFINDVPIVLLHSAGIRIFEAMLLADCKKNIYLETSFSLPYLLGSSLENDFAFAYKKIGADRILYGSDFPYISQRDSMNIMMTFFEKYNFSNTDVENIMINNALNFFCKK